MALATGALGWFYFQELFRAKKKPKQTCKMSGPLSTSRVLLSPVVCASWDPHLLLPTAAGVMQCFGRNTVLPSWGSSSPQSKWKKSKQAVMQHKSPLLTPFPQSHLQIKPHPKMVTLRRCPVRDTPRTVTCYAALAWSCMPAVPRVAFCLSQPKKLCSCEEKGCGGCNLLGLA